MDRRAKRWSSTVGLQHSVSVHQYQLAVVVQDAGRDLWVVLALESTAEYREFAKYLLFVLVHQIPRIIEDGADTTVTFGHIAQVGF